jgi:pimeloyl-ACP methyl ester carboxylesterase
MKLLIFFLVQLFQFARGLLPSPHVFGFSRPFDSSAYDWLKAPTSRHLSRWDSCYSIFQCANLVLPLDWNDETNPNNVTIAVIRLPANLSASNAKYGGPVITNPGGPGGSGIWWAVENAERIQKQFRGDKDYDIISFDPRGVFNSRPSTYCFSSAIESEIWYDQKEAAGSLTTSEYSLKFTWAAEKARSELCAATSIGKYSNGDNIRQHISTASVARDVLQILRELEHEKESGLDRPRSHQQSLQAKTPLLQYFGTSYGTMLGQMFASLYPEHVGRMILDANVDPYNWVSRFESGIDDHDAIREYFFERCFAAQTECSFSRGSDKGPTDVKKRYEDLLTSLDEFPKFAYGEGRAMPITRFNVEDGFMTTSYQPLLFFKPFANFLNDLLSNENPGIPFYERAVPTKEVFTDDRLGQVYRGAETTPAVHCGDGPLLSDEPIEAFREYLDWLNETYGPAPAAIQADFKTACWTWPKSLRTKWRYDGPFNGNVSILFLNNRLDPATPAKNARKGASNFRGSFFLEQNAAGHGAMWPPGSDCISNHVRRYLADGVMPADGTVCEPECKPFDGGCGDIEWIAKSS